MFDFFEYISNSIDTIINYVTAAPSYFEQAITYFQLWYFKMWLWIKLSFVSASYQIAITLLNEIGFNVLIADLFNAIPSELRFYAFTFKVPEGISIYMNCATTAMCMRMMR